MSDPHALNLIQEERFQDFNRLVESLGEEPVDLSGAHLRAYDLRKFIFRTANLTNAYLRSSDLRSLDLSLAQLNGASIKDARVSGVLFPRSLPPEEIRLSLEFGTRLRDSLKS